MPLDAKAKQFLGPEPVVKVGSQVSAKAESRFTDYRQKEFLQRAGTFYEELMGFFLEQRKRGDYMDDEAIGAIALLAINSRESYGSPQNAEEKKAWTPEMRTKKLEVFDGICESMQSYYDENS